MNRFLALSSSAVLLGATAPLAAPPAQVTLAERSIESHTGMIPEFLPGATPADLDKRIPLPAGAALVGSVVMTPAQSFGDYGSPGFFDLFYDLAAPQGAADYASALVRAGWREKPARLTGATLYCMPGAPAVLVRAAPGLPPPLGQRLQLTVYRNRPGIDPCK